MPLPRRILWVFAAILFLIVVLPMLFISSREVGLKRTERLGLSGLIEGIGKNYIILIILVIIAVSVVVVLVYFILHVTPK